MLQRSVLNSPTRRVVSRLYTEGWVDCPGLDYPALSQYSITDLRQFVLQQLQHLGGWMWLEELRLSTLIFAIPSHEFQFHPHLSATLEQLEAEGLVQLSRLSNPGNRRHQMQVAIVLVNARTA